MKHVIDPDHPGQAIFPDGSLMLGAKFAQVADPAAPTLAEIAAATSIGVWIAPPATSERDWTP